MDEEKIICPVCKGIRCKVIFQEPMIIQDNIDCYEVCACFYDKPKPAIIGDYCGGIDDLREVPCIYKCRTCGGSGYITWIEQLFLSPSELDVEYFQNIFNILNDEPNKTKLRIYDNPENNDRIKKKLKRLIKD